MSLATVLAVVACGDGSATGGALSSEPQRADTATAAPAAIASPDTSRYIVVFKSSITDAVATADALQHRFGGERLHVFTSGTKAVVLRALQPGALAAITHNPNVEYVERDRYLKLATVAQDRQLSSRQWALDRIDAPYGERTFDHTYTYFFTGAGTHIYIVDTGIERNNVDLVNRLSNVAVCTHTPRCDPYVDTYGHGTGVASIAAGNVYGVARGATVHSVRVSSGEGVFVSNIGAGLDWIRRHGIQPGVVNISLGGADGDIYLDKAIPRYLSTKIQETIDVGYIVVKSAGNSGSDACNDPQNTRANEIVVAASDMTDHRAVWGSSSSNYGRCISLFAPGSSVATTSNALGNTFNGTSAAAPIVSGVVAQILGERPRLSARSVRSELQRSANRVISDLSTPNNLLVNALHQTADLFGPTKVQSTKGERTVSYRVDPHGGDPNNWTFVWSEQSHTNLPTRATVNGRMYSRTIRAGESGWTRITVRATSANVTVQQSITLTIARDGTCSPAC